MPLVLAWLILALTATSVRGQGERASGSYVSPDHWSREAIHRLAGLGLADAGSASLAWPIRVSRIRALLTAARDTAESAGVRHLLDGWLELLDEESGVRAGKVGLAAQADAGYQSRRGGRIAGALVPREGGDFDYTGAIAAPEESRLDMAFAVDFTIGAFTAAATRSTGGDVRGRTESLYGLYGTRAFEVWAGRRPLSFSPANDGIVLGREVRIEGVGIELPDGFVLPSFLRHLGEVRLSQTLGRMDRSGPVDRPWFLSTRLGFAPSNSLAVGLNRAAIFGGAGNQDVTLERVVWMLLGQTDIGSKDSDFENQVASIDFNWQSGVGGLSFFGEYAFDDAGTAFLRVPGITIGARLASVPGAPMLATSIEFTHFASHCCGHPPWYQHGILAEGWSDRGVLLGHPLGGEGSQLTMAVRADAAPGLIAEARFRLAHRDDENLLVPSFQGRAVGGDLNAMARVHPHARLVISLSGDRFRGGRTRHDAWLGVRALF